MERGGGGGGDSKAQAERKRVLARYNNITSQLSSLKFHVYHACLQDILHDLKQLSLAGQEHGVCAARVAYDLRDLKQTLSSLHAGSGPYERFARSSISVKDGKPCKEDWVLDGKDGPKAVDSKLALIKGIQKELDARFANPAYVHFAIADFRFWLSSEVTQAEEDGVVFAENLWGPVVPELRGACKEIHLAKGHFFLCLLSSVHK